MKAVNKASKMLAAGFAGVFVGGDGWRDNRSIRSNHLNPVGASTNLDALYTGEFTTVRVAPEQRQPVRMFPTADEITSVRIAGNAARLTLRRGLMQKLQPSMVRVDTQAADVIAGSFGAVQVLTIRGDQQVGAPDEGVQVNGCCFLNARRHPGNAWTQVSIGGQR